MLFSSTLFIFYFLPIFFITYFLTPKGFKNLVIVLFSVVFYVWGDPNFFLILGSTIVFNFFIAQQIARRLGNERKYLVAFAVIINVSFLLYFKYANFFVENINALLSTINLGSITLLKVVLPIGISFFTFHQISYIVDVGRGVKPPSKNLINYALYILIFPQLIAGPIIRYNEIADQLEGRKKSFDLDNVIIGFYRFCIGLGKKVLIANVLGAEADRIFSLPDNELSFGLSWLGAITYTFQIFFDFSGYSDMAIGLARMMGFRFPENFNHPYISQNITEFWRRWHISLSRWMRDYLYIPLGGNRVSTGRLYFNLWVVFLISGFWHGAQWTFILWGAYHGFFLAADRLFLIKIFNKIGKFPRVVITFFLALIGWVVFRANDLNQAFNFYENMVSCTKPNLTLSTELTCILVLAVILSFVPLYKHFGKIESKNIEGTLSSSKAISFTILSILLLSLSVGSISSSNFNPFIYFQF